MLGWKRDDIIVPGDLVYDRYGSAKPLPRKSVELADYLAGASASALPTLDQGNTSRCVSFSGAEVIWARLAKMGLPRRFVNIPAAYVAAQRWEQNRKHRKAPLADGGLHPTDYVQMLSEWGVGSLSGPDDPAMDESRVLDDIDVGEYQRAASHKVTGWRRVDDSLSPADIVETAKRYLAAGFPGMDGTDLDAGFQRYAGGIYTRDPAAPSLGGHMTSTLGFDDDLGAFLKLNHWGKWGNRGLFWMSYATYASGFVSDRYFLDASNIT